MKIGMLFSGYGGQFVSMGKDLYDNSRLIQEYFEEASNCLDANFVKLCFASSDAELSKLSHAYTSIFLFSCSLYALLKDEAITPNLVAGHGLGEYAALFAAGSITFPDGLYLLNKYAAAYNELLSSLKAAMLRVKGLSADEIAAVSSACTNKKKRVDVAIYNAADQYAVSGTASGILCVKKQLEKNADVQVDDLDPAYGLHSSLANELVEKVAVYFEKVDFRDLKVSLVNCVEGTQINKGETAKYALVRQINAPVLWDQVLDGFADMDLLLAIGPGTELADLASKRYPDKKVFAINKKSDVEQVKAFVLGEETDES